MAVLFLSLDEFVHYLIESVREMFKVAMELKANGQYGKGRIVDQGGAEVRKSARRMLAGVLV